VKEENLQRADIDILDATVESPQWIRGQSQRSGSALIQETTADAAFGIWKKRYRWFDTKSSLLLDF